MADVTIFVLHPNEQYCEEIINACQQYDPDLNIEAIPDLRNAPALAIIDRLLEAGVSVKVYDPVAGDGLRGQYGDRIAVVAKVYEVLDGADALFIATEWREFHNPDFARMASAMRGKAVYDGRNLYEPKVMAKHGFRYASVGRPAV